MIQVHRINLANRSWATGAVLLALLMGAGGESSPPPLASPPTEQPSPYESLFVEELSPEVAKLAAQQEKDERTITVRQANLFHARFIETVLEDFSNAVALDYRGLVATDRGAVPAIGPYTEKLRIVGGIGLPLGWHVSYRDVGVFTFWVSTQPTTETTGETMIEGQKLFINVNSVVRNSGRRYRPERTWRPHRPPDPGEAEQALARACKKYCVS